MNTKNFNGLINPALYRNGVYLELLHCEYKEDFLIFNIFLQKNPDSATNDSTIRWKQLPACIYEIPTAQINGSSACNQRLKMALFSDEAILDMATGPKNIAWIYTGVLTKCRFFLQSGAILKMASGTICRTVYPCRKNKMIYFSGKHVACFYPS